MCKYCEIDDITNEAKRHIRKNQRVTIKIVRNMLNKNLYYLEVDTNSYQKEVIDIRYCPFCRKEVIMNIDNNKPVNNILRCTIIFYEEETKPNTWGSNNVEYEIYYNSKDGIMQVHEIGAFGDSTLVAMYQDRRNRGITLKEMIENIEEISNMTYKEFKEKILKR